MGFFDFLKPSNLLALGGAFLPIPGGPFLGAALGGGLGSALEGENVLEGAAGGAAMAGIGKGLSALSAPAAAATAAPAASATARGIGPAAAHAAPNMAATAAPVAPAAAATAAQGGGGGFMGAMSPMEKMFLGSQALGTISNMYGTYEQGRIEDERRRRREALARALAPYFVDALPPRGQ